jgi:hypothetical protein
MGVKKTAPAQYVGPSPGGRVPWEERGGRAHRTRLSLTRKIAGRARGLHSIVPSLDDFRRATRSGVNVMYQPDGCR